MDKICISLGGSIISRESGVNVDYVNKLRSLVKKYEGKYKFIIVVGGGYANSMYVSSVRPIIKNQLVLDQISIAITRINAMILMDLFSDLNVYPNVITNLEDLKPALSKSSIAILGGLLPGITTDSVTILACEVINAKVAINVSSFGYVYDKPPSEKGAKKLEKLTHDKLLELAFKYDTREARSHFIFDLVACKLAKRARIELRFVNDDVKELEKAINGSGFKGSLVK